MPLNRAVLPLLLVVATLAPASAQDRLFVLVPFFGVVELHTSMEQSGAVRASDASPLVSPPSSVIAGGGRYLVWPYLVRGGAGSYVVAGYDLRTRSIHTLPSASFLGSISIAADALGSRIFVGDVRSLREFDLESGRTRVVSTGFSRPLAHTAQGDLLLDARRPTEAAVIEVGSGAVRATIPIGPPLVSAVFDPSGSRLYLLEAALYANERPEGRRIRVIDVAAGSEIARLDFSRNLDYPNGLLTRDSLQLDPERGRVLLLGQRFTFPDRYTHRLVAFDPETLAPIGTRDYGPSVYIPAGTLAAPGLGVGGPASPYVIAGSENRDALGCVADKLWTVDPGSGTTVREVSLDQQWRQIGLGPRCAYTVALISPPAAPRNTRIAVNGNSVALSWQQSGVAARFEIAAGYTADAPFLLTSIVGPRFSVDRVPPGRYIVRVRAVNEAGHGEWSSPLEVNVPSS